MQNKTTVITRTLRAEQTPLENVLWYQLRARRFQGWKFRRQHPIGSYVVDFYCHARRLIIEVDGDSHGEEDQIKHDKQRSRFILERGFRLIHFSNQDIRKRLDSVLTTILTVLGKDLPGRGEEIYFYERPD